MGREETNGRGGDIGRNGGLDVVGQTKSRERVSAMDGCTSNVQVLRFQKSFWRRIPLNGIVRNIAICEYFVDTL